MDRRAFVVQHLLTRFVTNRWSSDKSADGFTIVELIAVIIVTGILIGLLFGPLDDLYTANNQGLKSTIITSDINSTMQSIRQTASISVSYDYDSAKSATDPIGTAWASNSSTLVTTNYATSTDVSGNKTLLKANTSTDPTCVEQYSTYIFFVKDRTLYRRALTKEGLTTTCGGATWDQKQTCPAGTSTTTYPRCKATDSKLLSNVDSFSVVYYASTSSNTTTTPSSAKAIQITIKINTPGSSKPVTSKMRIKRTNGS